MKKLFLTDTEFAILEDLLMAVPDEVSDRLDCDEMSSRVLDRRTNNYKESHMYSKKSVTQKRITLFF